MKNIIAIVIVLLVFNSVQSQSNYENELIELAEIYHNYHFSNDPPKAVYKRIKNVRSSELKFVKSFIQELIGVNNNIGSDKYLKKPDSVSLKSIYAIRGLNYNMYESEAKDDHLVLDSLLSKESNYNEFISCYYGMLFTSITNKNRPLKMAKINFDLNKYQLENKVEKGIFFLESMETFGTLIWGYINVPKPPNFGKAINVIVNYPSYNNQPYYQYLNLNFEDFELKIDKKRPKESFKNYHLNKYMNTILYHAMSLSQTGGAQEDVNKILMGSIIKNESYWKHSETPEVFENIFRKIK